MDNKTSGALPVGVQPGWRRHFSHPAGILGWFIGHIMVFRNRKRSLKILPLLNIQPGDRVLEIGFGSGMDIRRVSEIATHGFVAGVDHSDTMLRQASKRNAAAIRAGRVDLRRGSAEQLPFPTDNFDKLFAINVAQFWADLPSTLQELRRVLKPGGLVALAVQTRSAGATEETARQMGAKLEAAVRAAGFSQVRLETRAMKPVSVVCAMGIK